MTSTTFAKRFPVGRPVLVKICSDWVRGTVAENRGTWINVLASTGILSYHVGIHFSVAHRDLRVGGTS